MSHSPKCFSLSIELRTHFGSVTELNIWNYERVKPHFNAKILRSYSYQAKA